MSRAAQDFLPEPYLKYVKAENRAERSSLEKEPFVNWILYPLGNSNFIPFSLVLSIKWVLRRERFRLVVFLVKI